MSNSFVFINDNNELHKLNMNVTSNQTNLTFDNNLLINGNLGINNGNVEQFRIDNNRVEVKNSCLKVVTTGNTDTSGRPSNATEGDLRYNSYYKSYEFFNGTNWSLMLSLPETGVGAGPHIGALGKTWSILMKTGGLKNGSWLDLADFGNPGTSTWKSLSLSTANGRTELGDGNGLYEAFFIKKNITQIALVDGTAATNNPYMHNNCVVYNLIQSTGDESIYDILKRLNQTAIDLNVSILADENTGYDVPSVITFTGGIHGYSGLKTFQKGSWPDVDKFCIWGINHDSDNDAQILCTYSGNLRTGKSDAWRGTNPSQTFWSYWGMDWNTASSNVTISVNKQTDPGISTTHTSYNSSIYLLAM